VDPGSATDPGRVTMHRLNRAEYNNTVRDLLGTTARPADAFPVDDRGAGFDNIADVLSLSVTHVDRYNAAAEALIEEAFSNPDQRARLVACDLAQGETCARQVLAGFMPRAFRRPVADAEIDQVMPLVNLAVAQGDSVEVGLKLALKSVLLSPHFIFRVELDPNPTSLEPHPLSGYEAASRLSYFLWSSMPDDELFASAAASTLLDATVLQAQVTRMLQSPKASALVDNFAGQWLYLRGMDDVIPSSELFPDFDDELRAASRAETASLFNEVVFGGLAASQMLTAEFTFLNDRLAEHYGLPAPGSSQVVRVDLPGNTQRRGLLTQATFLTVTSYPTSTSPVLRGKWVLDELLCQPVPAPPADLEIPDLQGEVDTTGATVRELLAQHRADPICSTCHSAMDPIGLGLENYDAVGEYRTEDRGNAIDVAGQLPDGRTFTNPMELAELIATDPNFARCVVEKLYTYALGRAPVKNVASHMDAPVITSLAEQFSDGFQLPALVAGIVTAPTFVNRRGDDTVGGAL
jgi:hypothetical protein